MTTSTSWLNVLWGPTNIRFGSPLRSDWSYVLAWIGSAGWVPDIRTGRKAGIRRSPWSVLQPTPARVVSIDSPLIGHSERWNPPAVDVGESVFLGQITHCQDLAGLF